MPSFAERLDDYFVRYLAYSNYKNYVGRMDLQGNERVLEVGCGGGNLSRFLAERLPLGELVCIDNSEYWFEKAKKRLRNFRNAEVGCEDILNLQKGNYFDAIVVHYVLHDINEIKKAINVMSKSLKDKGRIFIREPIRKTHGISFSKIRSLMSKIGFLEQTSKEGYSFPIRGKVYEGIFQAR